MPKICLIWNWYESQQNISNLIWLTTNYLQYNYHKTRMKLPETSRNLQKLPSNVHERQEIFQASWQKSSMKARHQLAMLAPWKARNLPEIAGNHHENHSNLTSKLADLNDNHHAILQVMLTEIPIRTSNLPESTIILLSNPRNILITVRNSPKGQKSIIRSRS